MAFEFKFVVVLHMESLDFPVFVPWISRHKARRPGYSLCKGVMWLSKKGAVVVNCKPIYSLVNPDSLDEVGSLDVEDVGSEGLLRLLSPAPVRKGLGTSLV